MIIVSVKFRTEFVLQSVSDRQTNADEALLSTISRRQTNQLAKVNKRKIHKSTFLPNCSGYSAEISRDTTT